MRFVDFDVCFSHHGAKYHLMVTDIPNNDITVLELDLRVYYNAWKVFERLKKWAFGKVTCKAICH